MSFDLTDEEKMLLNILGIHSPSKPKEEPKPYKEQADLIHSILMKNLLSVKWLGDRTKLGKETIKMYINNYVIPPESDELKMFVALKLPLEKMYHYKLECNEIKRSE